MAEKDFEKKKLVAGADEKTDVPSYDKDKTDVPETMTEMSASYQPLMEGVSGGTYIIDGKEYIYNSDISAGNTGEADVILVIKDNKPFALKLYKGTHTPNYDIIEKIKELKDSGFFVQIGRAHV